MFPPTGTVRAPVAVFGLAAEHQHASERLGSPDLGLWARRTGRQHLSDASARFGGGRGALVARRPA